MPLLHLRQRLDAARQSRLLQTVLHHRSNSRRRVHHRRRTLLPLPNLPLGLPRRRRNPRQPHLDTSTQHHRDLPNTGLRTTTIRHEAVPHPIREAVSLLAVRGGLPGVDGADKERAKGRGEERAGTVDV